MWEWGTFTTLKTVMVLIYPDTPREYIVVKLQVATVVTVNTAILNDLHVAQKLSFRERMSSL